MELVAGKVLYKNKFYLKLMLSFSCSESPACTDIFKVAIQYFVNTEGLQHVGEELEQKFRDYLAENSMLTELTDEIFESIIVLYKDDIAEFVGALPTVVNVLNSQVDQLCANYEQSLFFA